MRAIIEFVLYLLLLYGSALLVFGVETFSFKCPLLLFLAMLGVGFALALIGKRWGRGMLLLAIPMAVLLAHLSAERLWSPQDEQRLAQVYRLTPDLKKGEYLPRMDDKAAISPDSGAVPEPPHFKVKTHPLLIGGKEGRAEVRLPEGLDLHAVASGLNGAADMIFVSEGSMDTLYVSVPDTGTIYRLERKLPSADEKDAGAWSWRKSIFRSDLDQPMGLAWHSGCMYVATRTAVLKIDNPHSCRYEPGTYIVTDLPPALADERRALAVASDGTLYLSVAAGDTDPESMQWQQAAVLEINSDGEVELFAAGLHHARALERHPESGEIWAVDDAPETLGFDAPADEINILERGADYGWPFCYAFQIPDRELGTRTICRDTKAPLVTLPPHSVPAALAFGTDLNAPRRYRSMLYVALLGRSDDPERQGFRVIALPFDNTGGLTGWGVDILSGCATPTRIYAQPAALAVSAHGNLYIADAHSGVLYRLGFPSESRSGLAEKRVAGRHN
jgi:glucose/arabinose dehydrogenase